jgi:hypothetical protein
MPTSPDWLPPVAAVVGATIVAVANFMVQRWRYRLDRLGTAVDKLCEEIRLAADLAAGYWLLDATQIRERVEARKLEPMLIGRQLLLQESLLALAFQDPKFDILPMQPTMVSLYDAMTGGDFTVAARGSDAARARSAQAIAAHLNGQLRQALAKRIRRFR